MMKGTAPTHPLSRARRLLWRAALAFSIWVSPDTNPFLQRALRAEARQHKPLLTIIGTVLTVCCFQALGWSVWLLWKHSQNPLPARFDIPTVLPTFVGGNPVDFIAILTAAACGSCALWASQARAAKLLRQEALKNTLSQLQLLPMAEERWLWLLHAQPVRVILLISSVGLPVYALAIWSGQWSVLDVVGIFLVTLWFSYPSLSYQPQVWKQRANATRQRRADYLTQWQEAHRQAQQGQMPLLMTPVQRLEAGRRALRLLHEPEPEAPVAPDAAPAAPPPAVAPPPAGATANGSQTAGATRFKGRYNWFWLAWSIGLQLLVHGLSRTLVRPLVGSISVSKIMAALPPNVGPLLPGFYITWPLMLSRLLFAPLSFFAFRLPPLVLVAPLAFYTNYRSLYTVAANVAAGDTFWTPRRAQRMQVALTVSQWCITLLCLGYSWHFAIAGAGLSHLLHGAPPTRAWAVAAAWTIALAWGAVRAAMMLFLFSSYIKRHQDDFDLSTIAAQGSLLGRQLTRLLLLQVVGYFVYCWLGGDAGFNSVWLSRLLPTLGTVAAFLLAVGGVTLLDALLTPQASQYWRWARFLWFELPLLELVGRFLYGEWQRVPFALHQSSYDMISPYVTLLTLFRASLWSPAVAWWPGALLQALGGSLALGLAAVKLRQHAASGWFAAPGWARLGRLVEAALSPLMVAWRGLRAVLRRLRQRVERFLDALNQRVIEWGQSCHNPILATELRQQVRRQNWVALWLVTLLIAVTLFSAALRPWQLLAMPWSVGPGGRPFNLGWQWRLYPINIALIIAGWLIPIFSTLSLGRCLDREHANGQLVFLFLTPLTNQDILRGKAIPALVFSGGLLAAVLLCKIMIYLLVAVSGYPWVLLTGILGLLFPVAILLFTTALQMLFAVRAQKPTEGQAKAFLWLLLVEMPLAMLTILYSLTTSMPAIIAIIVLHCALAYSCWRLALASLQRQRYSDFLTVGSGVN